MDVEDDFDVVIAEHLAELALLPPPAATPAPQRLKRVVAEMMDGKRTTICDRLDETVHTMKMGLCAKIGGRPEDFTFVLFGRPLTDEHTLTRCRVRSGTTLRCVPHVLGGGSNSSRVADAQDLGTLHPVVLAPQPDAPEVSVGAAAAIGSPRGGGQRWALQRMVGRRSPTHDGHSPAHDVEDLDRGEAQQVGVVLPWQTAPEMVEGACTIAGLRLRLGSRGFDVHQFVDSGTGAILLESDATPALVNVILNRVPDAHIGACAEWLQKLPHGPNSLSESMRQLGARVPKPEDRAIRWWQLQELGEFARMLLTEARDLADAHSGKALRFDGDDDGTCALNMHTLNKHVVMPLTRAFRCSYVELVCVEKQQPLIFMSHAWSTALWQTLRVLEFYLQERNKLTSQEALGDISIWICVFAINQHDLGELSEDLMDSPFLRAIQSESCSGTVVVLDGAVTPFQRAWCVLEAGVSLDEGRRRVGGGATDSDNMGGNRYFYDLAAWLPNDAQTCDGVGVSARATALLDLGPDRAPAEKVSGKDVDGAGHFPLAVADRAAEVDMERATASDPNDLKKIFDVVRSAPGGFAELNRRVGSRFVATAACVRAAGGDFDAIERLCQRYGLDGVMAGLPNNGSTPVLVAAMRGKPDCLGWLLAQRGDPDRANNNCATPVYMAAQKGHEACLGRLLARRADPNTANMDGATPVFVAAQACHEACLGLLLEHRADPDTARGDGATPMFMAAHQGHEACLGLLLAQRADPNKAKQSGATPVFMAAQDGHAACLGQLLEQRADPNRVDNDGVTPVFLAAQNGHEACLDLLLEHSADPDRADNDGTTPVFMVAQNCHEACLGRLLEHRADPNGTDSDGVTPVFLAAQNGHEACLGLLLEHSADPERARKDGATPVFMAAQKGHEACLRKLLEQRAHPNRAREDGATPLQMAAQNGHAACLGQLLEQRADANRANNHGVTPALLAAHEGHEACLGLLLEQRADPDMADDDGDTPVLMAAQEGQEVCLRLLFERRADPNRANTRGETPVFKAAEEGHEGCLRQLLEHSADPHRGTCDVRTPALMAAQGGHDACVAVLQEYGATPARSAMHHKRGDGASSSDVAPT